MAYTHKGRTEQYVFVKKCNTNCSNVGRFGTCFDINENTRLK